MQVALIAVFILAVSTTEGLHPDYANRVEACVKLYPVDGKETDLIRSFGSTGVVLDENNLTQKCYLKCLGDGTGVYRDAEDKIDVDRMMTEANSLVFEVMPANVSGEPVTREEFKVDIEACAKIDGTDSCDTGYKQLQCFKTLISRIYTRIVDLNTSHNMTTPDVP